MPEGNNTVPESGTQEQKAPGAANGASLSFDDILADRGYQSEFDKRVAKAIETAKTKWQASADADKSKAVNDAVAGLSARLTRAEITAELVKAKARDADVVLPLIDTAKLKQTDTGLEGLAEQIKAIKESKAYLFEGNDAHGGKSGLDHGTGDSGADDDARIRRIMGLPMQKGL